ncbi:radical SAM/SPASM domain-containing protein [Fluviicola sp.]|jgi:uncharacterized protein|uniref:radical SAM/SPASM domain-containing protein n=1 Tax=Fluviicola sp. TaxID=1917219 RepID=UPI00281D0A1F|nr:radical SAM protein [Fluviicola sp.]MDR0802299.1 radical SAM protein [Fluviicola sp.]
MKYSRYNTILKYQENYALFNSINQKVIFIEEIVKDLINAAIVEGIDNLQGIHPTLYDYLIQEEFIIDENIDEIEEIKKLSKSVDENHDNFFLTINPTMNCNFKCWYCYETHIPQSKLGMTMINKVNKLIDNQMSSSELKSFNLSFFGGEPLLYFEKDVIPIIDYYLIKCKEKSLEPLIGFTSNGYLINDKFIDYFRSKGVKSALQITLDGYKEKHDKIRYVSSSKGSYEKIVKNIKLLVRNEFFVNIRINYTTKNIEDTFKIANEFSDLDQDLKDRFLKFDFHRVWQDNQIDDTDEIAQKNIQQIKETGIDAQSGYSADNVRNSCYADKRNSAVINYNSDVYKCTARDFLAEKREGYLTDDGIIIWENDSLDKRMSSKFNNKPCLSCKIMPLCNGGCSQHALDNLGREYCVFFGDENEKDKVIINKINEIVEVNFN